MGMEDRPAPPLRFLLAAACIVILIAGMKAAASILNPLLLALLLAQTIRPLPDWLIRKGWPSGLSVLVTLLIVLVGGLAVASLLGVSMGQLIDRLPAYQAGLMGLQERVFAFLSARGVNPARLQSLEMFSPNRLVDLGGQLLGAAGQLLSNALLLIFLIALLLFEFEGRQGKLAGGKDPVGRFLARFQETSKDVRKYLAITGGVGLAQAVLVVVLLWLLGVDFPFTWGVLFFFLNFIPVFGFLIALIPPALVALLKSGWKIALVAVLGYLILVFVGDNLIKPKFMKKGLDISILMIVLSLIFWGWVFGSVGAILAVPLTLTVKNLLLQYSERRSPHRG
ncbi:MAG: AI-2E family transporter [candidate division NC10 bacterium]|nr:AI-2E family transporter [candidate division NC10 bacterium]